MVIAKAYKIQDVRGKKRTGVVARSLADLRQKGASKLAVPKNCRVCLEDGTDVEDDDYFKLLPPQTVLVFVRPDETWEGPVTVLKHATEKIFRAHSQRDKIIERVQDLIHSPESHEMLCVLVELVNQLDSNIEAEERSEDKSWFDGLSPACNTKVDAMRSTAKARIRKYFSNAKESFEKASKKAQPLLMNALKNFEVELKKHQYFGDYFARSARKDLRLCCDRGWFDCKGPYNEKACSKHHKINPYAIGKKNIEKSRQIFPTMISAAENCPKGSQLNWVYFFELLFTHKNLKLVHVVCHVKGEHKGFECQAKSYYKKQERLLENS
ncbi:DNA fragmentation factor subunit beta [Acropora cervicornis]|uniref:DNAation factor subunit beta n=1 Tax=Acropora cervicornis TaxID=6130 RepID=A0AAD9QAE7_ACRCE|nr:DNA fragmentation factor subunit beta [Acropora cervicornis]